MKVSLHIGKAGPTEAHNDRTMYGEPYIKDVETPRHWNCYADGLTAHEAELQVYRELFGKTLERQNERAREMRKHDRIMDMETWMRKHPPREAVIGIGNADEPMTIDDAWKLAERFRAEVESAGGVVISMDGHRERMFDDEEDYRAVMRGEKTLDEVTWVEGSGHVHVRYVMPYDGKPDVANCLQSHGVERPNVKKGRTQRNNEAVTWTRSVRDVLEDAADELFGVEVDRSRMTSDVASLSPRDYAALRRAQREVERRAASLYLREKKLDERERALDERERNIDNEVTRRFRERDRQMASRMADDAPVRTSGRGLAPGVGS